MEAIKSKKPVRSYSGEKWFTNSSNKQRLVIDFDHKCAYCDDYDKYSGGYNSYHVEHFAPKEKFKELQYTYDNLLYCCPYCNLSKSDKWVSNKVNESVIGDRGFIDPCNEEYYEHLKREKSGNIIYTTPLGKFMYEELKLYLRRHSIIYNLERLRMKKTLIKARIDESKNNGLDSHILEGIYRELCILFCDYYDLFFETDD